MKFIICLFLMMVFVQACKKSDFAIKAPEVGGQTTIKKFDHTSFDNVSCSQCHENKRPQITPIHGDGLNCIECHKAEVDFFGKRTWTNLKKFSHVGNIQSCNQCHGSLGHDSRPEPKNFHPTEKYSKLDCINCHQYSQAEHSWKDLTFNQNGHQPAPKSCNSCHEQTRPQSHIKNPSTEGMKSADCFACHGSSTNWNDQLKKFDHTKAQPKSCLQCHKNDAPKPIENHPSMKESYSKMDCMLCHTYNKNSEDEMKWKNITFDHKTHKLSSDSKTTCLTCHKDNNNSYPKSGSHLKESRSKLNCNECHSFVSGSGWKKFQPFNHQKIENTETCESCHNVNTSLKYKTASHVKTNRSCMECHSTEAWKPAKFFHESSDTNCLSCHNGVMASGKSINHVPTKAECSLCHNNQKFNPVIAKTHSVEEIKNCLTCHNGETTATPKNKDHVVTTLNCSTCHTNDEWKPAIYLHTAVDQNCLECHNGKMAKGLSKKHFATETQCSVCHTNPIGLSPSEQKNLNFKSTLKNTHTAERVTTTSSCSTCHNDKTFVKAKSLSHVATTLDCSSCHTLNAWKPALYVHVTEDTNCLECHNGKVAKGLTQKHIKTQTQCSSCHTNPIGMSTSAQTALKFTPSLKNTHKVESILSSTSCKTCHDGVTTATVKNQAHVQTTLDCMSCHSLSAWKPAAFVHVNTDTNCISCHNDKTAKGLSSNHIGTTNQCSSCHTNPIGMSEVNQKSLKFSPALKVTHTVEFINSVSTCTTCHNGITTATSKSSKHVATTQNCALCHGLNAWKPATFYHENTHSNCISCHNGTSAAGLSLQHIPTKNQCSSCHTSPIGMSSEKQNSLTFKPALKNSHTVESVTTLTNCSTCHDGKSTAASKTAKHITTKLDCASCHALSSWKPATYKHQEGETQCLSCHNGNLASGKPVSHVLNTTAQCSVCHSQTKWAPAAYDKNFIHNPKGNLPTYSERGRITSHKNVSQCSSCHDSSSDRVKYTTPKAASSCLGCHQKDFNGQYHRGNEVYRLKNCLECHGYNNWTKL